MAKSLRPTHQRFLRVQCRWVYLYPVVITSLSEYHLQTKLHKEGDPYRYQLLGDGKHWEECAKKVKEYDRAMILSWKTDIDMLLVFVSSASDPEMS
jgi:hypothetical protein